MYIMQMGNTAFPLVIIDITMKINSIENTNLFFFIELILTFGSTGYLNFDTINKGNATDNMTITISLVPVEKILL